MNNELIDIIKTFIVIIKLVLNIGVVCCWAIFVCVPFEYDASKSRINVCNPFSQINFFENILIILIKVLIELEFGSKIGRTALMNASNNPETHSKIIKLLLEENSDPNLQDHCGNTALMLASKYSNRSNDAEKVRLLLDANSNPDLQSNNGYTALIYACMELDKNSDVNIIKLLLEIGCDPNIMDEDGHTALYYFLQKADLNKNPKLLEKLIRLSHKSVPIDGTFYNIYLSRNVDILCDYTVGILKGEIRFKETKSSRNQ